MEREQDCAICMDVLKTTGDEVQTKELPCDHMFHRRCVKKWLKNHGTCPLCRFNVWSVAAESSTDSESDMDEGGSSEDDDTDDDDDEEGEEEEVVEHWDYGMEGGGDGDYAQEDLEEWGTDYILTEEDQELVFEVVMEYADAEADTYEDDNQWSSVISGQPVGDNPSREADSRANDVDLDNRGTSAQIYEEIH